FGIFTTVVNWGTYFIFTRLLSVSIYWSNILAWFFAVLFAYLTNRRWVFHSNTSGTVLVAREIFAFFSSRAFSGGVDMLLLFLMVHLLHMHDFLAKVIIGLVVVLLNYVLSKLVFRYYQQKMDV
ncbi:MAG: GtrA family protein, partial [Bacillota bacterium]|nr:GtrA family protein [Bacillota bacterium]